MTAADWATVKTVPNFMHSIFDSVEVSIGDTQITSSSTSYAYRSMFEYLFNTDAHSKASWMKTTLPDSTALTEKSSGQSKKIEFGGRLNLDLVFQEKAIIGGCYCISISDSTRTNQSFTFKQIPAESHFHQYLKKLYSKSTDRKCMIR